VEQLFFGLLLYVSVLKKEKKDGCLNGEWHKKRMKHMYLFLFSTLLKKMLRVI